MEIPPTIFTEIPAHINRRDPRAVDVRPLVVGINTGKGYLSGPEARALLAHANTTERAVAARCGLKVRRVKEVCQVGVVGYFRTCEWIEILTGLNTFSIEAQRRFFPHEVR